MTITGSRISGNTASADSAGDQGIGGGIANINLGPRAPDIEPDAGMVTAG
jgi:hypothetical protein